jgi:hypothetical protein
MVSNRLADANNEEVGRYDPSKPKRYLACLDMNNLYGHSMTMYMPRSNFRFLTWDLIQELDVRGVSYCSPTGYILEVEYAICLTCSRLITIFRSHRNT